MLFAPLAILTALFGFVCSAPAPVANMGYGNYGNYGNYQNYQNYPSATSGNEYYPSATSGNNYYPSATSGYNYYPTATSGYIYYPTATGASGVSALPTGFLESGGLHKIKIIPSATDRATDALATPGAYSYGDYGNYGEYGSYGAYGNY